jgi:YihY family inner membrane protein
MEKRISHAIHFGIRVLRDFFLHNHGLLLSGSVAFNVLLSLVPLCAVLMALFSGMFERELLMDSLATEISIIAPGLTPALMELLGGFLDNRKVFGGIGFFTLLFFSSKAFRVLEDAFAIIFHRPLPDFKRKFWVSALMPYLFILIVATGLILITAANAVLDPRSGFLDHIPLVRKVVGPHAGSLLYLTGFTGLVLLFTLFYIIMPVARVSFKRALAGAFTAAVLWEITRHLLVSYYVHISAVNAIYGSMATIIIVLMTMEAAAVILLLGAQVIAELQYSADANLRWYQNADIAAS